MVKKLTINECQQRLGEKQPYIEIMEYRGKKPSLFLDKDFGEFEGVFQKVLSGIKMHPDRAKQKRTTSFEFAEKRLKEKQPYLKLIAFGGSYKKLAKFLDPEYGEFEGIFDSVIQGKKKHPNRSKENIKNAQKCLKKIEKQKKTCLEKYGHTSYTKTDEYKKRRTTTLLKKYGVTHQMHHTDTVKKFKNTLYVKRGGPPHIEVAQEYNISQTMASRLVREHGQIPKNYKKTQYTIETTIENVLKELNVTYTKHKRVGNKCPDIILPEHKIIIECDGLRWHSDLSPKKVKPTYHIDKKTLYKKHGYKTFFFREDEIRTKLPIIKSMIQNACNLTTRIYARKCTIQKLNSRVVRDFLNENHLMGYGKGIAYGLYYNDTLVSVIQVTTHQNYTNISRFCIKTSHTVVGGFTKLLKHIIEKHKPNKIITFIDMRYGSGQYLSEFGFKKETEYLSFRWTDGKQTYHRLKFKGNTGYTYGLGKIWDCGQAKWVLDLTQTPT